MWIFRGTQGKMRFLFVKRNFFLKTYSRTLANYGKVGHPKQVQIFSLYKNNRALLCFGILFWFSLCKFKN